MGVIIWLAWPRYQPPAIEMFESSQSRYDYDQAIALNWEIHNVSEVENLIISATKGEQTTGKALETYTIQDIKNSLECEKNVDKDTLKCRNWYVGKQDPGEYTFNLEIVPQQNQKNSDNITKTTQITVNPPNKPTITIMGGTKPKYELGEQIQVKFKVTNYDQVEAIRILRNNQEIQNIQGQDLENKCSQDNNICNLNLPLPVTFPGNYSFTVKVISKYSQHEPTTQNIPPILVEERRIPLKIDYFSINGSTSGPVTILPDTRATISWQVTGKEPISVSITQQGATFGSQGSTRFNPFPPGTEQRIVLTATDADGETTNKEMTVYVNSPPPPPVPEITEPDE